MSTGIPVLQVREEVKGVYGGRDLMFALQLRKFFTQLNAFYRKRFSENFLRDLENLIRETDHTVLDIPDEEKISSPSLKS